MSDAPPVLVGARIDPEFNRALRASCARRGRHRLRRDPAVARLVGPDGRPKRQQLSTYMGHASITITMDRYGHLIPGSEREAAERLDAYLAAPSRG